eukprot:TRINITY_DN55204_c0_g1_i1.p1 TRINITY_DN55204_c0_g1~~TRINITY_DN55204_c0_g1_i1.p1  ORF type:complete len:1380 (-),score=161.46 TRINITY_DN55204_c0_g1_i1:50-3601(-)
MPLDYFRNYNPTERTDAFKYFESVDNISESNLLPCGDIAALKEQDSLREYLAMSDDRHGIMTLPDGSLKSECWKGHWFVATACRHALDKCIPMITGGDGWYMAHLISIAFLHNLPFAFAVAKNFTTYVDLPRRHDCLFYWWTNDATMVNLSPKFVYIPFDSTREELSESRLQKLAVDGVLTRAPAATLLAKNMRFSHKQILELLLRIQSNANATASSVSCEWVLANRDVWKTWVSDPTDCPDGQGLVRVEGEPIDSITENSTCSPCSPGRFSVSSTGVGKYHRCQDCPRGRFSSVIAASSCQQCPAGKFGNQTGLVSCRMCSTASFQNKVGESKCSVCRMSFTTRFEGAERPDDCVCAAGTYFQVGTSQCVRCSQTGILCTGGRTQEASGRDTTPLIKPGFMTLPEDPLSVFTCIGGLTACQNNRSPFPGISGTVPQMCGPGFALSPRCSVCETGYYISRDRQRCLECTTDHLFVGCVLLAGYTLQLVVMLGLYFRFNSDHHAGGRIASSLLTFLQMLQTLMVLPLDWPSLLIPMRNFVFAISADGYWSMFAFRHECLLGTNFELTLVLHALTPLTPFVHFAVLAPLAKLVGHPLVWVQVANICGLIFANLFNSISGLSLGMFAAESMPNGFQMTQLYPELRVASELWLRTAPVSAVACCLYCGGFFAYVIKFALTAPKAVSKDTTIAYQYRFVIGPTRPECWWWILIVLAHSFGMRLVQTLSSDVHVVVYLSILLMCTVISVEVHLMPYKFVMANFVDVFLKIAIVLTLILSTAFIRQQEIDSLEVHKNNWAIVILFLLSACLIFAGFHMLRWLRQVLGSPVVVASRHVQTALMCRDVFAEISMLPEKTFVARMSRLEEVDLWILSRCTEMLVAALLAKQPGRRLYQQRLIPSSEFSIWDRSATSTDVLKAILDGSAQKIQNRNAIIRSNLRSVATLARNMAADGDSGSASLRRSLSQFSASGSSGSSPVRHVRRRIRRARTTKFESRVLSGMDWNPSRALDMSSFVEKLSDLTELSEQDLQEIFETVDTDNDGLVSMGDCLTLLMGEQPNASNGSDIRFWSLLEQLRRGFRAFLSRTLERCSRLCGAAPKPSERSRFCDFPGGQGDPGDNLCMATDFSSHSDDGEDLVRAISTATQRFQLEADEKGESARSSSSIALPSVFKNAESIDTDSVQSIDADCIH